MSYGEQILEGIFSIAGKIFGTANDRELKRLWPMVGKVKSFYPSIEPLSDAQLLAKTDEFRRRFCKNERAEDILFEAFAVCREASHRTIGERKIIPDKWTGKDIRYFAHFDVQILGGIVLHEGKIAEMITGEGKTLVATLPAYLNGLLPSNDWIAVSRDVQGEDPSTWTFRPFRRMTANDAWTLAEAIPEPHEPLDIDTFLPVGRGVHVITVNDYLAHCGLEENQRLFEFLGLRCGAIQSSMDAGGPERKRAYMCDITYGTNSEFGFDYLRDNLKIHRGSQVQRSRSYAVIDEVDSVLVDEARTPLIISGSADHSSDKYYVANRVAQQLSGRHQNEVDERIAKNMRDGLTREDARMKAEEGVDFVYSERDNSAKLTEQGTNHVQQLIGIEDLYSNANLDWLHYINNALRANTLYKLDTHYVVKDGEVIIVDEFTGRMMEGRRWSDGLHQAVEAKEKLRIKEESQTVATITYQNFFKLYDKIAGMTGTAMTEAKEFLNIYKLEVVSIPTNRPLLRKNWDDLIYGTEKEKYIAICDAIVEMHAIGRPVLVGTVSIERSELLSELLKRRGIAHEVLNAKQHAREGAIVAQAGQFGKVTIATNMAGRGTDIKLGTVTLEELIAHWQKWRMAPKDVSASMSREMLEARLLEFWVDRWIKPEAGYASKTPEEWKKTLLTVWKECGLHPITIATTVAELGGLHVLGTERHEARRIDNQLRGRCARQGDPGSSRFYLSLEDDLMRIFAGDRAKALMQRFGLANGEPIAAGMINRAVENAQRKVEERNFEIRKNLLEYDAVMNEQRTIIYERRQSWLEEMDLRESVLSFIEETLSEKVEEFAPTGERREIWQLDQLANWCRETFLVNLSDADLQASLENGATLNDVIMEKVMEIYAAREKEFTREGLDFIEKYILLELLDRKWMDHLYTMDLLKESIYLRSYAQQDPKLIYKREGYEIFQEMWEGFRREIADIILRVRPAKQEAAPVQQERVNIEAAIHQDYAEYEAAAQNAGANAGEAATPKTIKNTEKKVGPNDPCICGSGKKYKKCCGRR